MDMEDTSKTIGGTSRDKIRAIIILVAVFFSLQIICVFLAFKISHSPEIQQIMEKNRPAAFNPESGEETVWNIVIIGVAGTLGLLFLKKYRLLKLKYIVMMAVFGAGMIISGIFTDNVFINIISGIILLIIREKIDRLYALNFSVLVSVLGFGAMGQFIDPLYAMILLFILSIYDIVGVLYTRHITYLWFGNYRFESSWREILAFVMPVNDYEVIMVGAGDFAFPLLFTFSSTKFFVENAGNLAGIFGGLTVALFTTFGFMILQWLALDSERSKTTGLPGLPFVTVGGVTGYVISRILLHP